MKLLRRCFAWVASLMLAVPLLASAAPALKAGVFEPPYAAPEFPGGLSSTAASAKGDLKLQTFRGKLVLLVFGFTHCPEICPTTLATLAQARQQLGAEAKDVQVVYVSVDPERDDADRVRKYLGAFDASFVGGTGKPQALESLRKNYGVIAKKIEAKAGTENYGMSHSTSVFLIDREGRLRALMPYGHPPADFVHDLRLLLATK
ncbi:SCO family protein [Burkholderiaceae bacterium UC74_6]